MMRNFLFCLAVICVLSGCKKNNVHEVNVVIKGDPVCRHVLNQPFNDPCAYGVDYMNKHLPVKTDTSGLNVNKTGSYTVTYTATDEYGNIGTGSRTVEVFNELEYLQGCWSFYKYAVGGGGGDTIFIETLNVSQTINRLFCFSRFSNYDNAPVQAHIEANLMTIDTLQYNVGPSSNITITFYGTGTQKNENRLEFNYSEIKNNTTKSFTAVVTRE